MRLLFSVISFLIFLGLHPVSAQEIPVSVETRLLPSSTVVLAEFAQMEISFSSANKILVSTFSLPPMEDLNVTKVEILAPQKSSLNSWKTKVVLTFMPLNVGEVEFPSFEVPYAISPNQVFSFQTLPLKITVVNALNERVDLSMLKDIKPPVQVNAPYLIWFVLFFLLLGAAAFWIVRRHQKPKGRISEAAVVSKPADEIALEKLRLILDRYKKSGDFKTFYNDFSIVLREYLSQRYALDALEMTTSEIFAEMRRIAIDRKICLQVKEMLSVSDLVKFAKAVPSEKQIDTDIQKAFQFVEETKIIRQVKEETVELNRK